MSAASGRAAVAEGEPSPEAEASTTASPRHEVADRGSAGGIISLRMLFSDAAVYGLASVFDRAIGFLLLPLMTALMSPEDYGIVSLFTTTANLGFVLVSLCVHQSFLRHYTEAADELEQRSVINTGITLAIFYWAAALPALLLFSGSLNRLIFGLPGSVLVKVLAATTLIETFDALAGNRLQADGRPWPLFWIRIGGTFAVRSAGVAAVMWGAGAWGWILADSLGRLLSALLIAAVAFPKARLAWRRPLIWPMASYGALLVPAMLSFYAMTVTDKYAIRALCARPLEQVGLYSVGERIAGVMHLANLAFILGWQRFAFRNMHHPDGPQVIARGMTAFVVIAGYLALGLSMLGDDLTRWVISPKFAEGIQVIVPLTLAAYFGGLASAADVGLHKRRRPMAISTLNLVAAGLNVALNLLAIPRWGIAGSAWATLVSQAFRLAVVWRASQRLFPLPMDYRRVGAVLSVFAAIAVGGRLLHGLDPSIATAGQLLLVTATPVILWLSPLPTPATRQAMYRTLDRLRLGINKTTDT